MKPKFNKEGATIVKNPNGSFRATQKDGKLSVVINKNRVTTYSRGYGNEPMGKDEVKQSNAQAISFFARLTGFNPA